MHRNSCIISILPHTAVHACFFFGEDSQDVKTIRVNVCTYLLFFMS